MKIVDYFKGVGRLIAIGVLVLLAVIFYFIFGALYAAAAAIFVVIAIIVLPYFVGRQDRPEKKGKYSLKKVRK
jgi:hypothetical protein